MTWKRQVGQLNKRITIGFSSKGSSNDFQQISASCFLRWKYINVMSYKVLYCNVFAKAFCLTVKVCLSDKVHMSDNPR